MNKSASVRACLGPSRGVEGGSASTQRMLRSRRSGVGANGARKVHGGAEGSGWRRWCAGCTEGRAGMDGV
ncbi:hypothetical protein K439DRAFT_1643235 [Ramaria rubella]|nr:hypothetical protein K439DRAFT_1643235 [Ramaria rubella]